MSRQRVLIAGAGALGIATAVRLQRAGHDVAFAVRSPQSAQRLAAGVTLRDDRGRETSANVPAFSDPADGPNDVDWLLVATKCQAAPGVVDAWKTCLKPGGAVVTFQNGVQGDEMSMHAGPGFVESAVYYPATLVRPGLSHITGPGRIHLGPWPRGDVGPGSLSARARDLLSAVVSTDAHDDMFSVKWNKLIANCAMTSLGVLSGLTMAGMMQHHPIRHAFLQVLREGLDVAQASGAKPMRLGKFSPRMVVGVPAPVAHVALQVLTRKHGQYKSSSQQSMDRGEPSEVDYLNGHVVQAAGQCGMQAPWNAAIVDLVHRVEADSTLAGPVLIDELMARAQA